MKLLMHSQTSTVQPWTSNSLPHFNWTCDCLSMLGFKLICISKRTRGANGWIYFYYFEPARQGLTHWSLGDMAVIEKVYFFKLIVHNNNLGAHCEIAIMWMPQNLIGEKSKLVQAMAWCRQATSHYLSQYQPRSMSPYVVTRPQWVKFIHNNHVWVSHTSCYWVPQHYQELL